MGHKRAPTRPDPAYIKYVLLQLPDDVLRLWHAAAGQAGPEARSEGHQHLGTRGEGGEGVDKGKWETECGAQNPHFPQSEPAQIPGGVVG